MKNIFLTASILFYTVQKYRRDNVYIFYKVMLVYSASYQDVALVAHVAVSCLINSRVRQVTVTECRKWRITAARFRVMPQFSCWVSKKSVKWHSSWKRYGRWSTHTHKCNNGFLQCLSSK